MGRSLISNPPYNMKWEIPVFAQMQSRFQDFEVPPKSNSNYAFVLTANEWIDEKAALLLPQSVLAPSNEKEKSIVAALIEYNLIEAVISLPDKMFESTSIAVCILVLNKNKKTRMVEMIDMRQEYQEEERLQNGQYGGASHENRTYRKTVKIITDSAIEKAINAIEEHNNIPEFCKSVSVEEIREKEYRLTPTVYIEFQERDTKHREYADIADDYNRVIKAKNAIKLTVNESIAKVLGLYEVFLDMKNQPDVSESFKIVGQKAEKENFIVMSKNKAEFKIENKDPEKLPEIMLLFLTMWKQHIMYLNNEENRLLAEFRDALLPEFMSGKIAVNSG